MKVSNETKVGILATMAIVLLVLGYNILRGKNLFSSDQMFYSEYSNVEGISTTSQVKYQGLIIGKVRSLDFNPETKLIKVGFTVKKEHKLPVGTVAKIASGDLLGTKVIDLIFSKNSEYHITGQTLKGEIATSLTAEVEQQILPLKQKAEQLMSSIDTMIQVTEFILLDSREEITKSMADVSNAIEYLSNSAYQIDTLIEKEATTFQKTLENVEKISKNLRNNSGTISALLNNSAAISDSIKSANLTQAINDAEKALEEFAEIARKIEEGEGNIGLLLNDTALYHRIVNSASSLDTFLLDPEIKVTLFGKTQRQKQRKADQKKKNKYNASNPKMGG